MKKKITITIDENILNVLDTLSRRILPSKSLLFETTIKEWLEKNVVKDRHGNYYISDDTIHYDKHGNLHIPVKELHIPVKEDV